MGKPPGKDEKLVNALKAYITKKKFDRLSDTHEQYLRTMTCTVLRVDTLAVPVSAVAGTARP